MCEGQRTVLCACPLLLSYLKPSLLWFTTCTCWSSCTVISWDSSVLFCNLSRGTLRLQVCCHACLHKSSGLSNVGPCAYIAGHFTHWDISQASPLLIVILLGIMWHLIVVLICISLMINNLEYLFMCPLLFYRFFCTTTWIFQPVLNWVVCLFCYWVIEDLCTFWIYECKHFLLFCDFFPFCC